MRACGLCLAQSYAGSNPRQMSIKVTASSLTPNVSSPIPTILGCCSGQCSTDALGIKRSLQHPLKKAVYSCCSGQCSMDAHDIDRQPQQPLEDAI